MESAAILLDRVHDGPCPSAVELQADRHTLQKRRWRGIAEDGTAVAVQLERPAVDGDVIGAAGRQFRIVQDPEDVVAIPLPEESEMAAKIGWYLGNRHIPVEVRDEEIIVECFPTLTDSLERIGIPYELRTDVLRCRAHSSSHRH